MCRFKGALTIWEDHFYPEIIDPDTGAAVADGEPGELVITTLTKEGMPLIRYRTRDLTRLLPQSRRAMRRIARISGRSDDMLIIRGVNVFPSQIEAALALEDRLAPHYLIELRRPGHMDELDVVVETRAILGGQAQRRRYGRAGAAAPNTRSRRSSGSRQKCGWSSRGRWNARKARRNGCSTFDQRDEASMPAITADIATDTASFGQFWQRSANSIGRLPPRASRNKAEADAAAALHRDAREARDRFLSSMSRRSTRP